VIDAAGQARWFQVGVELVAIRYDQKIDREFRAQREWRVGYAVGRGAVA
jgi:hypothetical protein